MFYEYVSTIIIDIGKCYPQGILPTFQSQKNNWLIEHTLRLNEPASASTTVSERY